MFVSTLKYKELQSVIKLLHLEYFFLMMMMMMDRESKAVTYMQDVYIWNGLFVLLFVCKGVIL